MKCWACNGTGKQKFGKRKFLQKAKYACGRCCGTGRIDDTEEMVKHGWWPTLAELDKTIGESK